MPIFSLHGLIFEWHDDKAELILKQRNISIEEVASVLLDLNAIQDEDIREYDELRLITIGLSNQGRVLVVVWTERNDKFHIITAYHATKNQQRRYANAKY